MTPRAPDSSRRVGNAQEHTFSVEGVTITVPDQTDKKTVLVQKDDDVAIGPEMQQQANFKPHRIVMNLIVDKDRDPTSQEQPIISPAVAIRVKLLPDDITHANGKDKIMMAYWYQGKWIIFEQVKHGFKVDGDYATATLAVWGDPPIGLGP